MTAENADIRKLLELHADGELDAADRPRVEALLSEREDARAYLEALEEIGDAVRLPTESAYEAALERGAFEGLFARVMNDAAAAELGEAVRAASEVRADAVDFAALQRRIDVELDAVDAERASAKEAQRAAAQTEAQPSVWARFLGLFGESRGVLASAVTALVVAGVLVPLLSQPGDVVIHNVLPEIEEVQKGFAPHVSAGNKAHNDAPVVWFEAPEGSGVQGTLSGSGVATTDGSGEADGSGAPVIHQKGAFGVQKG